ncbi:hypothetical protein ILUMI_11411 [Ignelater luminosus]|uniref:Uncharacterized protein n=1 Tax=Ignelater luminosus TaxID=2038154 RepID=A0A8K0GDZ1_IGNLU|nr:hypothetical protein ILUMI_11411 [Ignelater luminosus]
MEPFVVKQAAGVLKNGQKFFRCFLKIDEERQQVQQRVSAATGISLRTINRIAKEGREIEKGEKPSFSTPNKIRKNRKSKVALDDFDKEVAKKVCGTTKIKGDGAKKTEWWNGEIRKIVKEKKTKWKNYLSSKNHREYEEYKKARKIVTVEIKKVKKEAFETFGNTLKESHKENQKQFYSISKNIKNRKNHNKG